MNRTALPAIPVLILVLSSTPSLAQGVTSGPWIQRVTPGEAWILWEGDETAVVEWGPGEGLGRETAASLTEGGVHHAHIDGLEPASRYHYRLRHDEGASDRIAFSTPSADRDAGFAFLVMSDTQHDRSHPTRLQQTVEEGVLPWLAEQLGGEPDQAIDLVLVVGDLVDDGWDAEQWRDEFFGQAQALFGSVPLYAAIGNHEGNASLYFDRLVLPDNGSASYLEHWWYLDRGNARIIGLDSNTPYTGETQRGWLGETLDDACDDDDIDFVFASMHHPYHSELWIPGETAFSGEVIALLDAFASRCGKPAVHFFGHTHGYSRGQSRDATHLMVNVATASGNIDYWGEYEQVDYEEFSVSLDEYGFVVVQLEAGDQPSATVRRIGLGDELEPAQGDERDSVRLLRDPTPPATPEARSPGSTVEPWCVQLVASPYCHPGGALQGASHWQIAASCDGFDQPLYEAWLQHENRYEDVDLQAGDHLDDAVVTRLEPAGDYCWRVRHRDQGLAWSDWSEPRSFGTSEGSVTDNLLVNPGGEDGTFGWSSIEGPLESLGAGECDGAEPHAGDAYFAVGGVCEDGVDHSEARQRVELGDWSAEIDAGEAMVFFGGWTSSYSGSDLASLQLRWVDADGQELGSSALLSQPSESWVQLQAIEPVPAGARAVDFSLVGTRNAGQDCDAYIDDLELRLDVEGGLAACVEAPPYPHAHEQVECEDTGPGPGDSGGDDPIAEEPERRCGCGTASSGGWAGLLGALLFGIGRRRRPSPSAGVLRPCPRRRGA
jgi:hypothetical protein